LARSSGCSERNAELKDLFARFGYRYLDTIESDHDFTNIPDAM
jgi:hypothetical protein